MVGSTPVLPLGAFGSTWAGCPVNIYCPKCEAANPEEAAACSMCGHWFIDRADDRVHRRRTSTRPAKPISRVSIVVFGILGGQLFAAIGGVFLDSLVLTVIGVLVSVVTFVFIPAFVASSRNHPNTLAIVFVCLLFGWTFLGWGIALIWAMTTTRKPGDD